MDVRLWGPDAWNTMHAITYSYPKHSPTAENKRDMTEFFEAIADVLPCFECRKHFKSMLRRYPITEHLGTRHDLTRWLVDRHNDVNRRLGKPIVDYAFVDAKYSDYGNVCPMNSAPNGESNALFDASQINAMREELKERKKIRKILNMVETILFFIALFMFIGVIAVLYKSSGRTPKGIELTLDKKRISTGSDPFTDGGVGGDPVS